MDALDAPPKDELRACREMAWMRFNAAVTEMEAICAPLLKGG